MMGARLCKRLAKGNINNFHGYLLTHQVSHFIIEVCQFSEELFPPHKSTLITPKHLSRHTVLPECLEMVSSNVCSISFPEVEVKLSGLRFLGSSLLLSKTGEAFSFFFFSRNLP